MSAYIISHMYHIFTWFVAGLIFELDLQINRIDRTHSFFSIFYSNLILLDSHWTWIRNNIP